MQQFLTNKQNEMMNCGKNYINILNDPTGATLNEVILGPLYKKLNEKLCRPESIVKYTSNLIDMPDNIFRINEKINYTNNYLVFIIIILLLLLIIIPVMLYPKK